MEWFGDWAIPESIVMCESGGNFEAVNPSSGAGGAYQILPSTWELYGGEGDPEDASPAEQTRDRGPDLGRLRRRRLGVRGLEPARLLEILILVSSRPLRSRAVNRGYGGA